MARTPGKFTKAESSHTFWCTVLCLIIAGLVAERLLGSRGSGALVLLAPCYNITHHCGHAINFGMQHPSSYVILYLQGRRLAPESSEVAARNARETVYKRQMAAATAFLDSVQGQMTDAMFWDVMGPLYTCDPTERIGAQGDGGAALASTPCARPTHLLRIERRRSQRVCVSF